MRKYLHNYEHHLKKELERVRTASISENNKKLILGYHDHCFSRTVLDEFELREIKKVIEEQIKEAEQSKIKAWAVYK